MFATMAVEKYLIYINEDYKYELIHMIVRNKRKLQRLYTYSFRTFIEMEHFSRALDSIHWIRLILSKD